MPHATNASPSRQGAAGRPRPRPRLRTPLTPTATGRIHPAIRCYRAPVLDVAQVQELFERTPFCAWWGYQAKVVDSDRAVVVLPLRPQLLRPGGMAHGACVMGLADIAAWVAILAQNGGNQAVVTVSQQETFLRPGRTDLSCEARVVKAGRTLYHVEASVTDTAGRLVSRHSVSYAHLPSATDPA